MIKKRIVGIDIDIDTIKFVLAQRKKEGIVVEEILIEPIPEEIPDKDDYAFKRVGDILREKRWTKHTINMVIPTDDMQVRGIKIPDIPLDEIESVVKREVKKIYGELKDKKIAYQITGKHTIDDKNMVSIFFALVPGVIIEKISNLKYRVDNFDLKIFAAERIIKKMLSNEGNTIIIDIGHRNTLLTIFRGKNLEVYREINIAGEEITKTIANILQITLIEAEELKIKHGIVTKDVAARLIENGEEPRANQLNFAYQVVLEKLMRKITHSIDYFQNQNRGEGIKACFLTGGGSLLKGINELIEEELNGVKVDYLKVEDIEISGKTEGMERYINALGTAFIDAKVIKTAKKKNNDFLVRLGKQKKYILGAAALIPFVIFFIFTQSQYFLAVNEEKRLQSEVMKIADITAEYDKYDNAIKLMDNNIGMVEQLKSMRYGIAGFMYHLSDITLDNIYFSALTYNYDTKLVTMRGESYSRDGYPEIYVNDFVKNLEKEYHEVHLKGTQKTLQNVYSAAAFDIDMKIDLAVVVKNVETDE